MRVLVTATAALLAVAGCGGDDDDSGSSSDVEATVGANATFTGDACEYDGPEEVAVGDRLSVAVVNATADPEVGFALWKVPDGTTAEAISDAGIFEIVGDDDQARDVVFSPTEQDVEYELSAVLRIPGTWVVNCFVLVESGDLEYPIVLTATDDERE